MKKQTFFRRNGLSLVLLGLFLLFFSGQVLTGWYEFDDELAEHGTPTVSLASYLRTGHFIEITAENWESEFLQMAAFVLLTINLYQRGSSESKKLNGDEEVDRDPRGSKVRNAPWPVKRGGLWLGLYESSLSIALALLFLLSLLLHALGGSMLHNDELRMHHEPPETLWNYVASAQFWFESFQNWQSEFLALLVMVVMSIYLRQRGSPQSKPVDAPHSQTGE